MICDSGEVAVQRISATPLAAMLPVRLDSGETPMAGPLASVAERGDCGMLGCFDRSDTGAGRDVPDGQ
jgi:hypothetical protein